MLNSIQWYPSEKFENLCTSTDGSFASLHGQGFIYHELIQVTDFSVQAFFLRPWKRTCISTFFFFLTSRWRECGTTSMTHIPLWSHRNGYCLEISLPDKRLEGSNEDVDSRWSDFCLKQEPVYVGVSFRLAYTSSA